MMIQGHTISELTLPADPGSFIYSAWVFFRGLTAPMFLICSGFVHVFANKKGPDGKILRGIKIKRLKRAAFYLFAGYLLHIPASVYQGNPELNIHFFNELFLVDILQLFAVAVTSLLIITGIFINNKRLLTALTVIFIFTALFSPYINYLSENAAIPLPLKAYLNFGTGSYFPVLPYISYFFAGAAAGKFVSLYKTKRKMYLTFSVVLFFSGILIYYPAGLVYNYGIRFINPGIIFIYSAIAFLLLAGAKLLSDRNIRLNKQAALISSSSLVVYLGHLFILYGIGPVPGIVKIAGNHTGIAAAIPVALGVIFVSYFLIRLVKKLTGFPKMTVK